MLPSIRKSLGIWLTTATCSYIWKKATLQKPRVYCVTGFYELTDAVAKTKNGWTGSLTAGVSGAVIGAATGVPIGGTIGPFANGKTIEADIRVDGPAIWAARFHQWDVEFLKMAAQPDAPLSRTINLYSDVTDPIDGVRKANAETTTREQIEWPANPKKGPKRPKNLSGATMQLGEPSEIPEAEEDSVDETYWKAFATAERRVSKAVNRAEDDNEGIEDQERGSSHVPADTREGQRGGTSRRRRSGTQGRRSALNHHHSSRRVKERSCIIIESRRNGVEGPLC